MDDNELIAEFMGLKRHHKETHLLWVPIYDSWNSKERLEYHRDWSWLMPVVEKIEHEGHEVDIYKNACEIDMEEGMIREVAENKIKATYKAVVEFIKCYNSQKQ